MWKCNKCKREFAKINQSHSCVSFPLENHFKNKSLARELFDFLIKKIKKSVGKIKIESLPCCIHLVSSYTFGAVWAFKDRIRIDFRLTHTLNTKNYWRVNQISKNRYLYYFDIYNQKEITNELIGWIKESSSVHGSD